MEKHYVKYLVIVVVFLFFLLVSFSSANKFVLLSPGEESVSSLITNLYLNLSSLIIGILIILALALLILIVVESKN